jgi:YVTN family beta-propeller protein
MGSLANRQSRRVGGSLLILTVVAVVMIQLIFARAEEPDKTAPPKYLSPIAMVADKAGQTIYIAQATAGSVAVLDEASRKVTATIDIGTPVSGVAISTDQTKLYVTAGGAEGKLCVIDIKSRKVTARIPVGHTPMSPVVSPDGTKVYLANRFGRQADGASIGTISVVDLGAGKEIKTRRVPREPIALDISKDGKTLFVANHLPAGAADQKDAAAEVTIMDMTGKNDNISLRLPNRSVALRGLKISPDGRLAVITLTLARLSEPMTSLDRPWMSTSAIGLIDVKKKALINTILLDDVDHGAANPWAIAWSSDSKTLCVSHAGTHDISVINMPGVEAKLGKAVAENKDRQVQKDLSFLVGLRRRLKLGGNGPRSMLIIGDKAYVGEYFTDSLSIMPISANAIPRTNSKGKSKDTPRDDSIALGPKTAMTKARRGEILFNDASKMSFQMWRSCSTCHPDGRADGLNWDLMNDGMGNPKSTKSLLLAHKTPPAMITRVRASAEVAVRTKIRYVLFSVQPEKNALAIYEYLKSLKPVPSPLLVGGKLSPGALRGKKLFKTAKCASCHSGKLFTDLKKHDVGTGKESEAKKKFDTPTLIEVWRTAPYLYDGRAVTMLDVLSPKYNPKDQHGKTSNLTKQELADLARYVLSL